MSRTLVLLAALLAASFFGRWIAADATSLEDMLAGSLEPSASPALLGPITSAGRVGWECKPERAAASARTHEAELPPAPGAP